MILGYCALCIIRRRMSIFSWVIIMLVIFGGNGITQKYWYNFDLLSSFGNSGYWWSGVAAAARSLGYRPPHLFCRRTLLAILLTKKISSVFHKNASISTYSQILNLNGLFRPLVATHLFKIKFPTQNFLVKIVIKVHKFPLIYIEMNSKDFLRHLVLLHKFKI